MQFNSRGYPFHRGRRLRNSESLRNLVSENFLNANDLVMPYFVREENDKSSIQTMPGIKRFSELELLHELDEISKLGIKAVSLFPKVPEEKKNKKATESFNEKNLVCRLLRKINREFPTLVTICDVSLDSYTVSGHDGITNSKGDIENDQTINVLEKMSLNFAYNGCKVLAPSDMMDGRIKKIRESLEKNGFFDTCILSYSSKFCSNFYAPFRDALGSKRRLGKSNKKTYQIDFRNRRESIKESLEDINEGADIIMVKPAGYYLDIIRDLKDNCLIPVAAFQVSGEYSMIKNAVAKEIFNYDDIIIESLMCIKRSGADLIFSYFSKEALKILLK